MQESLNPNTYPGTKKRSIWRRHAVAAKSGSSFMCVCTYICDGMHMSVFFLLTLTLYNISLMFVFPFFSTLETRPCRLGWQICYSIQGRLEHPLHLVALPVHINVWGTYPRKHRCQTSVTRVSINTQHTSCSYHSMWFYMNIFFSIFPFF